MTVSQLNKQRQSGFTIVELLIVIVIIGILAAITIVAYNGITKRAQSASAQSATSQAAKKLAIYFADNNTYPSDLDSIGIKDSTDSNGTSYQYHTTTSGYCITTTVGSQSYYQNDPTASSATSPTAGGCPGDGQGGQGAITNLITNPSFKVDTADWGKQPTVTIATSTDQSHNGPTSLLVTRTGTGDDFVYYSLTATANTTYTLSLWLYLTGSTGSTGNNRHLWVYNGSGGTPVVDVPYNTAKVGQWQRLTQTLTTINSSLTIRIYPMTGSPFYIDGVMLTEGSTLYNYADGSSSNWKWNGTPNASTSTGPVL